MRTFLVTGGAGFIGSHIAEALLRRGDKVRVLDSLTGQRHVLENPQHVAIALLAGPQHLVKNGEPGAVQLSKLTQQSYRVQNP